MEKVSGVWTVRDVVHVSTPNHVIQYQEDVTANLAGVADAATEVTPYQKLVAI